MCCKLGISAGTEQGRLTEPSATGILGFFWEQERLNEEQKLPGVSPTPQLGAPALESSNLPQISWDFCIQRCCQRNFPRDWLRLQWHVHFLKLKDLGLGSD